jgi:iron complex outermembrane receptor protein
MGNGGRVPSNPVERLRAWRGCAASLLLSTAITSGVAGVAEAQTVRAGSAVSQSSRTQSYSFSIPAQPLASAIATFSRVTGVDVVGDGGIGRGVRSLGVSGNLTAQQALTQLLSGTGLSYRFTNASTVAIQRPNADGTVGALPSGAIQLETIDVQGEASGAYAGGQVATGGSVGILGNRDVMNTPFNVTNYTAKTIEDQQARSVGDVVKNDPSVRTTWADGSYSNQFFIRGFPVGNPDMSINGLYGMAPYQIAGTSWIDRVEVLKGPSALLNGMAPGGSIGGAINLVTKRATDDPITRWTLGYISDSQFGTGIDVSRRYGENKEFGVRFNGSYANGRTAVDGQSNELGQGSLGLDYRGERLRLSADLIYQRNHSIDPVRPIYYRAGFQIPKAPNASADLGQNWYYAHCEDYLGIVRGEFDITNNVTAYATFGAHRNTLLGLYNFEYIKNPAGDFDANNYFQPTFSNAWTGEAGVRTKFETGSVRHELTVSATQLNTELGNRSQTISTYSSNIYNPARIAKPDLSPWYDWTPKTSAATLSSIAIADSLYFLNDRVQVILGGRYQSVIQKGWNVTTGAQTADYDKSALTPAVGLVVKPVENVSLYANYIEGLSQGPTAPVGSSNFGEIFPPIKSTQYEAGVKVDFGRVTTTLSAFQIEQPSGYLNPTTNSYGINGEIRNRGVELNVFGQVTDQLRLLGGAAFMDGVQTKTPDGSTDGMSAVGIPDVQVNLGAEWDTPFIEGLTLTGRVIYTSSQYASVNNTQSIPDWTRFDLGARYTFLRDNGKPVTIRAGVENVFDKSYWAAASSIFGLARGAPRTFLVSATFDF